MRLVATMRSQSQEKQKSQKKKLTKLQGTLEETRSSITILTVGTLKMETDMEKQLPKDL